MEDRMNIQQLEPDAYKAMLGMEAYLAGTGLDAKLKELEAAGRLDKLVLHDHNRGKGAALRSGFEMVSGDIVLIQDADLEYNPLEYPKLIEPQGTSSSYNPSTISPIPRRRQGGSNCRMDQPPPRLATA